jgi:hypothetical protein
MAEDKRQNEEFLSQLASISQSFNFISNNIKNISIEFIIVPLKKSQTLLKSFLLI